MLVYKLSMNIILEIFEDGGLALIVPERRLVVLNSSAVEVVKLLDGYRGLGEIAFEIANYHDIGHDNSVTQVLQDIVELCVELTQLGVIEIQPDC